MVKLDTTLKDMYTPEEVKQIMDEICPLIDKEVKESDNWHKNINLYVTYPDAFKDGDKPGLIVLKERLKGIKPKTAPAIAEAVSIMKSLQKDVPQRELEQKRLDALNSFVFNVDTPADLVNIYARYHMRNESLETLDKIQDAFFNADRNELRQLAVKYLDPGRIQIFVVADKLTKIKNPKSDESTLEDTLKSLADSLGLPFREIELR